MARCYFKKITFIELVFVFVIVTLIGPYDRMSKMKRWFLVRGLSRPIFANTAVPCAMNEHLHIRSIVRPSSILGIVRFGASVRVVVKARTDHVRNRDVRTFVVRELMCYDI